MADENDHIGAAAPLPANVAADVYSLTKAAAWKRFDEIDAVCFQKRMLARADTDDLGVVVFQLPRDLQSSDGINSTADDAASASHSSSSIPDYLEIRGSKHMFSAMSEHFAAMFNGGFSESVSVGNVVTVKVQGVDAQTFGVLKRFVHGGSISTSTDIAVLVHLFAAAEMYLIHDCCRSIQRRTYWLARHDPVAALAIFCNIDSSQVGMLGQLRTMAQHELVLAGSKVLASDEWLSFA